MKVWLLDNGSIVIEHTQLMWNVPGPQVRIPSYAVLVEHDDGLFLFDTGFDLEHTNAVLPFELPEQTPEQTIPAQLELAGFSVPDVTTLVNSHLHFDHVGGNKHFAVRNVVHEQELAQARSHEPFEFFGYSDKTWDHDRASFEPVSRRRRGRPRPVALRDAGPHDRPLLVAREPGSPGTRPMLFAFDVVYTQAALERGVQPGFHIDPRAGVRSIARVKEVAAEHGADVYFSHDADAFATYKHAPDFYEL